MKRLPPVIFATLIALVIATGWYFAIVPMSRTSAVETQTLQVIQAAVTELKAKPSTAGTQLVLPGDFICLAGFYASKQELARMLSRQLTMKENWLWAIYGTDEDNMNLIVAVQNGNIIQLMKFHSFDFFGASSEFRAGCGATNVLNVRLQSDRSSGPVIQLSIGSKS